MAYWRPNRLEDALSMLKDGAVVAAGCTDLLPATDRPDLEMAHQRPILDVTGIAEMHGIEQGSAGIRIAGASAWTDILRSDLPKACDALKQAAFEVGSVQIQNSGTIAGNLCNASPAADGVPPLLLLDASVELASMQGKRLLPLEDFILGPRQTAREADELLTAVHLPARALGGASAFAKLGARHYLVISIAMAAARAVFDGHKLKEIAIAVGACSPVARRLREIEAALLAGSPLDEAAVGEALDPIDDVRGDAAYRRRAAGVLVRRLLADLRKFAAAAA